MPRPVAGARRRRRGLPYPDLRPRRHPAGPILVAAVATFLALGAARPAAGQAAQDTTRAAAGQDTTKTRAELIRERIRTLGPLIRSPDSLAADSARADSLARVAEGQIPRNTPPSLTGAARDSMIDALLGLDGYTVTEYRAKRARFEADSSRLDLREEAEVVTEGQKLVADSSIIFSQETAIACAYGKPTLSGGGTGAPVVADSLCFNVDTKRGIAHGARSEVTEGATWIVFSDESFTVGDTVYSHGGTFTDCNLEEPHYHFGAGELKVIRGDILVGRNVTFNFKDVPVFWLPFFAQSMKRGRRSGVLFPRFGVNDIARNRPTYRRRIEDVGFYWAINDYMGAEVALDWQADNFTSLRGSYDFRSLEHFLAGGLTYRKYWRAEGGTEFAVAGQTDWQMNERTRLNGTVSYTSSTRFVQQNSLDPRELNQSIDSRMGLNRKFDFGSLNLSGSRQQFLSDNTVNTTLPTVAFTLNSITLFGALPGDEKWYSNATWTGSLNSNVRSKGIAADNPAPTLQGNREVTANVTSRFQMGKFSWNQDFRYTDHQDRERTVAITPDSMIDLASRFQTRMTWSTGLDFQQRLIGTTTFTPGIQASGEFLEADTTGGQRVAAPTRININASLRTDLFRIFPGFGPVQAIRHKISPGVAWQYSPRPTITDRQREVFNINDIREQNRLRISLSQTFEAKMKQQPGVGPGGQGGAGAVPGDSTGLAADSLAQSIAGTAADTSTGPRRRQTVQPITLLSITTDAMVYDFVRAREDNEGFQTMELGQTIQSDLIRGLQLSFAHNLFRQVTDSAGDTKREFAPKLSRVTASFSLNSDSWLARAIGLGSQRGAEGGTQQGGAGTQIDSTEAPPQVPQTDAEFGLLGSSRGTRPQTQQRIGRAGTWNASFNYSLTQPRQAGAIKNQMLTANAQFQLTENWGVRWNTGYNFTRSQFTDHILTLTRSLHDWDANFSFVKAQNGNFSFTFNVQLRANQDIKLDYEQRELQRFSGTQF